MALRAIVISMMVHETNTFSPVPTPLESFHPLVGGAAIAKFKAGDTRLGGFLDVAPPQQPFQEQEGTMAVHLDHLMVPSRNKVASARLLAELLGVPWSGTGVGPFAPVYVNDGLTIDFDEWTDPIPRIHYCFRVGQEDFDVILERIKAAGIAYRSRVHGPVDFRIDTQHGGRIVYWNEPDGHQWEMLTVSYARQAERTS